MHGLFHLEHGQMSLAHRASALCPDLVALPVT